jgi:protease-4
MGSLAASGGYYISAPCRWIVANELTITGSIGVIIRAF